MGSEKPNEKMSRRGDAQSAKNIVEKRKADSP